MNCKRWHLRWQGRLICASAAVLFFLLCAQAQQIITAATNPVVIPNGQASATTTITWKAAPDYKYSEIYLSVDNAQWSEFARGADGSKSATLKLGSTYIFRMMVYEGQQGTPKIITTLTVTTKQGALPPPSSGGGSSSGGVVDGVTDRGSDYRLALIRNVRVEPGPRHIFIRFQGPPNQEPYVAIGRGAAIKKGSELVFGDNLVGGGFVGLGTVTAAEKAKGEYLFASAFGTTFTEDGLEPGRTYYYLINVRDQGGRTYQDTGRFVMNQQATTVKVVWERVLILDDSDDLSTGEIDFWFWANYGQPNGKFAQYYNGDADSGHGYAVNRTVVLNNAPNILTLSASGRDSDATFKEAVNEQTAPLKGPRSNDNDDENVAQDYFDLTKYDDNATVNFILNTSLSGALKFTIFGHFEIARRTVTPGSSNSSDSLGSTSSPLTTAPSPPPVKPQPRVPHVPGTTSPRLICDVAQEARARNSPAAPGLEQTCLAIQKGEALANQDPLATELRNQQPDDFARQGFDLGMAMAEGHTLLGPGKEKACSDRQSAAEQTGCRVGVLFSVDRNRNAKLAAKGAEIAQADQEVATARNSEADAFYRLGFDIATGIFGNPALGAQGNTATGPGSLAIRDSLNAAGQRGFNAAVAFHLARNYR